MAEPDVLDDFEITIDTVTDEEISSSLHMWDETTGQIPVMVMQQLKESMIDRNPTVRMSREELMRLRMACVCP